MYCNEAMLQVSAWASVQAMHDGIPCEGPAHTYGDNQSVLTDTMRPDSTLKKKSQSIAYHFVREGVACDVC